MIVFILTFIFILSTSYIDTEHLKDNDYIEDHSSRNFLRFVWSSSMYFVDSFEGFFGAGFLIAALFDQSLNQFRGKKFFHLGSTAGWDKFFKERIRLYISVKIILLILSIYLLFIK